MGERELMPLNFVFPKNLVPGLTVLVATVLLLWVIFSGLTSGKTKAQGETILRNAGAVAEGLDFFYNDQNRFPSNSEFADTGIMLTYFTKFPPVKLSSKNCPEIYAYKNLSAKSYELDFCLPKEIENFSGGWNKEVFNK